MKKGLLIFCLKLCLLSCLPTSLLADLSVDFGKDTVFACKNMSIILEPSVSKGAEPYLYVWNDGSTARTFDAINEIEGDYLYWVEVNDAQGNISRDSIIVSVLAECVWPGDANGDRAANHFDILSIGVGFGAEGPHRPEAHTNWIGQTAHSWEGHDHAGVNFVHADANGDGVVDLADMLVVDINYTQALPGTGGSIGSANDPSLFLNWDESSIQGDSLIVPLHLGTEEIPSDSTYGLAFTLDYDPALLPADTILSNIESSWLGEGGDEVFNMDFSFPTLGIIDIVLTRIDRKDIGGFGRLMDIIIVIEDLTGLTGGNDEPFKLSINNPRLIGSTGRILPLFTEPQSIVLSGDNPLQPTAKLELFPNPAQFTMTIEWQEIVLEEMYILDKNGKRYEIPTNFRNNTAVLDVTSLSRGLYTLIIREKNKAYIRRFLKN